MALQLIVHAVFTEDQNVTTLAPGDWMPVSWLHIHYGFSRMPKEVGAGVCVCALEI